MCFITHVHTFCQENSLPLLTNRRSTTAVNVTPTKNQNIAVLVQTELLPRHLLSVRTSLAPEVADGLQTILLSMHEDAEGRKTLYNTDETTKFDPLPGGESVMRRRLLETFYSR